MHERMAVCSPRNHRIQKKFSPTDKCCVYGSRACGGGGGGGEGGRRVDVSSPESTDPDVKIITGNKLNHLPTSAVWWCVLFSPPSSNTHRERERERERDATGHYPNSKG